MDSTANTPLLALKVMRVSRPSIAAAWQPFFSSSPSFSTHSTTSILSLQGKSPLPGNPKSLRDLTHVSQMLTLPSTFGSIQLGETFSSCLCVHNESILEVEGVSLKVEMQTASTKVVIAEVGGPGQILKPDEILDVVVLHEIKELGQHVLACTVSYRLPPSIRSGPAPPPDPSDPRLQTYHKYYKFPVTNPLSVKTKAHVPRSPSALLSRTEREKVFLEVHIQNLTQDAMWFERIVLDCAEGWEVQDANTTQDPSSSEVVQLFSGSNALIQPQDTRTYVYILTPVNITSFPVTPTPGSIIPLGRLDISWRSSFGEPGRLLTSMLSRRVPAPPPPIPVSALPSHLQRPPHSPGPAMPGSRPSSRPGSPVPYKSRQIRSQSPVPLQTPASLSQLTSSMTFSNTPSSDLEVDLVVNYIDRDDITVEIPFSIKFSLAISGLVTPHQQRYITLAVQHVQPARAGPSPIVPDQPPISVRQQSSAYSTPSPTQTPRRGEFNFDLSGQILNGVHTESPQISLPLASGPKLNKTYVALLPAPFSETLKEQKAERSNLGEVEYIGCSTLSLPLLKLSWDTKLVGELPISPKAEASCDFELEYFPLKRGFVKVGGLRVLLLGDAGSEEPDHDAEPKIRILKEWDVVAEIWVN